MKKTTLVLVALMLAVSLVLSGCSSTEPTAPTEPTEPPAKVGPYSWEEASTLMFENATICGPVVSASTFQPPVVVIAVGASGPSGLTVQIPDPGIFEEDPMAYFLEKTICVTGEIQINSFHGGPQIMVKDPSQIVIQ